MSLETGEFLERLCNLQLFCNFFSRMFVRKSMVLLPKGSSISAPNLNNFYKQTGKFWMFRKRWKNCRKLQAHQKIEEFSKCLEIVHSSARRQSSRNISNLSHFPARACEFGIFKDNCTLWVTFEKEKRFIFYINQC